MSKTGSYVRICESSVAENLITGYMASGVKLAAPIYRLFWGTSEIIAVLINCKKGSRHFRDESEAMVADLVIVARKFL